MFPDRPPNEDKLLRQAIAGHAEAFTTLYRIHSGPIYRFSLHLTGQTQIAEDVTQETFTQLLSGASTFEPTRGTLLAWLLGIARNLCRRALDGVAHQPSLEELPQPEACILDDFPQALDRAETLQQLRQAIATLPLPYREVVLLCELQELDYSEAARILGCPLGTVRSRLHRARAMLSSKLQKRCFV